MTRLFAAIAVAALAFPAAAGAQRPVSFSGSCDFSGSVTFSPPMTNTPQRVAQHAFAPGACTGTFTDGKGRPRVLDNAPVTYVADSAGATVSCLAGTATGAGRLLFPHGALPFAFSETRLVATPLLQLTGRSGGSMDGVATPSQSQDPVSAVQDCNGPGLRAFALDAHFRTTPAISG
ncbi:MAG: hypothetical protein ACJ77Z_16840 [Thermoleophilaceae bacterium]